MLNLLNFLAIYICLHVPQNELRNKTCEELIIAFYFFACKRNLFVGVCNVQHDIEKKPVNTGNFGKSGFFKFYCFFLMLRIKVMIPQKTTPAAKVQMEI